MSLASSLAKLWTDTLNAFNGSGYALFSIEAHLFCAVVLVLLFMRQQNSSGQEERLIWLRLLFLQVLYCLARIFRVLADVDIIPRTLTAQYMAAALTFGLFGCICWQMFIYTETCQGSRLVSTLWRRTLSVLPFAFNAAMLIASPFTGWYIDLSGGEVSLGVLCPLMFLVDMSYSVVALALCIMRRRKMTRYERDTAPFMAVYPAFLMICGPLQLMAGKMPFMCYVMAVADVLVYTGYADSLVSVDPLTKIPNRNAFTRILAERLGRENPGTVHVFAVDVEDLASVNSSHGRQEGDKVLVTVAGALRKFRTEEHRCYACRYQGDEFMITADIKDTEERELFAEHIRNYVSNAAVSQGLRYHVRVNIGWSKYEPYSRTETISGLIEEAERSMSESREQRNFREMWQSGSV